MAPLKLYYLSAEVAPFSETYELATFSRKITSKLHNKEDIDIRVSQPKYGYVSERKYILREVIRLKDIPVMFNEEKHIINMKSCFIPETRVQVYFMENNPLYKSLPDLIYKARNGRIFSDIDERFAFFSMAAIDTLTSLFWAPDVFICNDWQTSFLPILFNMPIKNYLIATAVGSLPSMFVTVAIGSGIEKVIDQNTELTFMKVASSPDIFLPIAGFLILVILAFILNKIFFKKNEKY